MKNYPTTTTIKSLMCVIVLMVTLSFKGYSAAHVSMAIENCVTTGNEIRFDFTLQNTGDQSMKFNSGSFRLLHDASILPSGKNTFTFSYVEGTSDFPEAFSKIGKTFNVNYNPATQLMQLTMSTGNYNERTAVSLPVNGKAKKVGTFSLKINDGSFVEGASVNTSFFTSGNGAVVYNNGQSKSTSMDQKWEVAQGNDISTNKVGGSKPAEMSATARLGAASLITNANYAGKPYSVSTLSIRSTSECRIGREVANGSTGALVAYPNPTSGKAAISFTSDKDAKYSFKVVDAIGKVMVNETITAVAGYNQKDINLEGVAKGIYFVSLQTEGNSVQTLQVVVQ